MPIPEGAFNKQPYDGRGWCVAEMAMSAIVKHRLALIDMMSLKGDEASVSCK